MSVKGVLGFWGLMYGIGTKELALYLKQGDIYSDPNWFYSLLSDWDKFHAHGLSIILHEITEKIDEVP